MLPNLIMNAAAPLSPEAPRHDGKRLLAILGALLAVAGLIAGALAWQRARTPVYHGMLLDASEPIDGLTFVAEAGRAVSIESYRGKPLVVYFGYTNCPDVCPTTLSELARATKALGERANDLQVAMITIDPERDTPDHMSQYARAFHPAFAGLGGSADQIADAAMRFGVHYARSEEGATTSAAGYAMEHSASVMVLDASGQLRLIFPFGMSSAEMAEDLRTLLES